MLLRSLSTLAVIAPLAIACGGSNDQNGNGGQGSGNGSVDPGAFVDPNSANPTDVDPKSACATSSAAGQGVPAALVFMFDRSGSMKDNNKWGASTAAMKSFFGDQSTSGLSASLQFFPQYQGKNLVCDASGYKAPEVPMKALPDPSTFAQAIDSQDLLDNTPTLPALSGAIQYARDIQAGGQKAAVVLVTDGEPNHCQSSVDSVATAAAGAAADVKTYVIGVGDALSNLNKIAAAGGTGQAILVSTSSTSTITDSFKAALGAIASQALSCDYKIPAPPNGQSIDPNKVNVRYTGTGAAGSTLTYSANCAADGWHYDSAAGPSRIILCPSTCDRVMKDKGAKIDVFFGCAVKGGIPH